MNNEYNLRPMLNAYPDSMGGKLKDIVSLLKQDEFKDVFETFYILPSIFNTDLDRGFSVIDYNLNEQLATIDDTQELKRQGITLKLDFILNHASVLSKEFQDVLKNGQNSKYADFFIQWNKFWDGYGEMTDKGYIMPYKKYFDEMYFRKPGLPILMIRTESGEEIPYWNTFYQEIKYYKIDPQDILAICNNQFYVADKIAQIVNASIEEGIEPIEIDFDKYNIYKDAVVDFVESKRRYLGQLDLNIKSQYVWEFYENTLNKLASYGTSIVRLDAFAYTPKEPGRVNFLNDPETWDLLEKIQQLSNKHKFTLLPEIHASYKDNIHNILNEKKYLVYDFFLPGLILDAIEQKTGEYLFKWGQEIIDKKISTINMLGCHDGIPLLDLKGLIPDERIETLIDTIVSRGGYVKKLHGQKNMYYQVNATYYSALGEDEKKLLLARAIQLFMPGKPQIWYLDLFAGKNNYAALGSFDTGGHTEINRTNLSIEYVSDMLKTDVVKKQLDLLKLRSSCRVFDKKAEISIINDNKFFKIKWEHAGKSISLNVDFSTYDYEIKGTCI